MTDIPHVTHPPPRHRGSPLSRCWLALLILGCLGLGTAPVDAALLQSSPTFFIEEIRVDGLRRASAELIVAESLLLDGNAYSEADLRQAVFRIQRLPFVLDATFALEKGTERGRYTLVVRVEEIRRFFFGDDLIFTRFTNSVAFDSFPGDDWTVSQGALAGIRFFLGRYGVLFGAIAPGRGIQAGYTQYNLFDRRIYVNLGLTAGSCCPVNVFPLGIDPTFASWQNEGQSRESRLTVGVPLRGDLGLRLRFGESWSADGQRRNLLGREQNRATFDFRDLRQREAALTLTYDTTDDPVLPSRGMAGSLSLDYQRVSADLALSSSRSGFLLGPDLLPPIFDPSRAVSMESEQLRLAFTLSQHWSEGARNTFSLSARIAVGQGDFDNVPTLEPNDCPPLDDDCLLEEVRYLDQRTDLLEGYFTARHSVALWGREKTESLGDLRIETTLEFGYDQVWPSLNLPENPLYRKGATVALVFRNSWGLFRYSFQVADYGRGF